ncbi:hypothetical protein [uncultured Clostridium sp.]|uniref:hypothetical protein n=1 Tax=uncultured Clostridium sp. TaxID=59620 RepID=UPI0025E46B2F|nr:hypothetical protein [uncultured Clostridium sp.]
MVTINKKFLIVLSTVILVVLNTQVVKGYKETINTDLIEKYSTYNTYTNERYGFSIEYPLELAPKEPSSNSDGICFSNIDNTVELIVWGNNNTEGSNAESLYRKDMLYIPKDNHITWCNDYAYNLTWNDDKNIYHKYSIVGKGSINTFTFKSPVENRELYEYVIERLDKSFKAPLVYKGC